MERPLQLSGQWYLKAEVTDVDVLKKPEAVSPLVVKALPGGSMELRMARLVDGQCQEQKVVLKKTDTPGQFTAYEGKRDVFIQKTRLQDHYIFYCEGELNGQQVRMASLVGRDIDSHPEALEDFKKTLEIRELSLKRIFFPKQMDACTPGSK
ncbi:lipocalin-1-like [Tenrec ecaudatus]|uniref:lipocalin-1-like n=1 Tax=Tenrec ecaudatus TaxID=94439 RepID=UPI003F5AAB43